MSTTYKFQFAIYTLSLPALTVLLACLYIFIGTVLGALILPVAIGLKVDRPFPARSWALSLDWAFFAGLAGVQLHLEAANRCFYLFLGGKRLPFPRWRWSAAPKAVQPERAEGPKTAKPQRQRRQPPAPLLDRLAEMDYLFRRPGLSLLKSLKGTIGLHHLQASGHFGFEDPSRTGGTFALLQALRFFEYKRLHIDLSPDFTRPGWRGRVQLILHLHLGYLLFLLLRFAIQVGGRWLRARLGEFARRLRLARA